MTDTPIDVGPEVNRWPAPPRRPDGTIDLGPEPTHEASEAGPGIFGCTHWVHLVTDYDNFGRVWCELAPGLGGDDAPIEEHETNPVGRPVHRVTVWRETGEGDDLHIVDKGFAITWADPTP